MFAVADARPEDSGTWACRTLHELGSGETELDNILVAALAGEFLVS